MKWPYCFSFSAFLRVLSGIVKIIGEANLQSVTQAFKIERVYFNLGLDSHEGIFGDGGGISEREEKKLQNISNVLGFWSCAD